jgi:3-dehydroquinate dehydratase-2
VSGAPRIEVLHGVNFDVLERRPREIYGGLTLAQLEREIELYAAELGLGASFFQTNFEGAFVERLHAVSGAADGLVLNPGAWTHYSWAIRDALELTGLPAVEVHLSRIDAREDWRALSVVGDLCLATFAGHGVEGYRLALTRLRDALASADAPGGRRERGAEDHA